jgi:ABC-2 type transport system ATP-binding protein
MTTPVIETHNLSKRYPRSKVRALENLSLTVNTNEVFGYLGPNGAGKTTTIKLLLDLIRPDEGSAKVFGLDAQKDTLAIRRRLGFMPGEVNLWENLTAREIITYFAKLHGGVDQGYLNSLIERMEFDPKKRVREFSLGNKRKLSIILSMMHRPELLILDEPTNGLDPLMQQTFYQFVREAKAEGRTVFMSSHNLAEVQAICERVAILRGGKLVAVQSVHEMRNTDFQWVTIRFRESAPVSKLANVQGVSDVQVEGDTLRLRLVGDFDPLLRAVQQHYIVDVDTQEPSLEEVFLTYYSENGKAR